MYAADIGLLTAMYGFDIKKAIVDDTLTDNAKGGIYENLIADLLTKLGYSLNYYRNKQGNVELEFILSINGSIVPVEVKTSNHATKSLNTLLDQPNITYGYKLIAGNIGFIDKK